MTHSFTWRAVTKLHAVSSVVFSSKRNVTKSLKSIQSCSSFRHGSKTATKTFSASQPAQPTREEVSKTLTTTTTMIGWSEEEEEEELVRSYDIRSNSKSDRKSKKKPLTHPLFDSLASAAQATTWTSTEFDWDYFSCLRHTFAFLH